MTEEDVYAALEAAVLKGHVEEAILLGSSISPDGRFAVAAVLVPSAYHLTDEILLSSPRGWLGYMDGSIGGVNWSTLDESSHGVLRFLGEADVGSTAAMVEYEGAVHRVPVRHGHFYFVAWYTPYAEEPELREFDFGPG